MSKPAPKGKACKCSYKGAWTCGGSVTTCKDPSFLKCIDPDKSAEACVLGGGDCGGYLGCYCENPFLECENDEGSAPTGTICKCVYSGWWKGCSTHLILG